MSVVTDQAFVTLATDDRYCQGALVLCQSLRLLETSRRLVVLFTPQVSSNMRYALERLFDEVVEVNVLDSGDSAHLALLRRPELGVTFTKIHCWCLIQYSKCVFMDADTLVCSNIDDLFEKEELSAAPDPGWPDCFNTGVFVYKPAIETYNQLLQFATEHGSFDGGDQGLLNSFFSGWSTKDIHKHLPFIYNLSGFAIYSYLPAFKQFGSSVKVVHFLGPTKPWHHQYNAETRSVIQENMSASDSMFIDFLNSWWGIYTTYILPLLAPREDVEKKSVDHQTLPAGDLQVTMRRQEEPATQEKPLLATKPLESRAERTEKTSPSASVSNVQQPVFAHKPAANVGQKNVQPKKSSLKMRKEKTPPSPSVSTVQIPLVTSELTEQEDIAASLEELSFEVAPHQAVKDEEMRRWEEGNVDYLGKDAFVNIQKKLDRFLK
uniref:glycogenin-2 isoform X2 n=1 Tax=Pristiophorus japonicus TaxID=55135 RepID=UPI00398E40A5